MPPLSERARASQTVSPIINAVVARLTPEQVHILESQRLRVYANRQVKDGKSSRGSELRRIH